MKEFGLNWNELMNTNWAVILRMIADLPKQVPESSIEKELKPQTTADLMAFFKRANRNAKKA